LPIAIDITGPPAGETPLTPNQRVRLVFGFDREWDVGLVGD